MEYIYNIQKRIPNIRIINCNYQSIIDDISHIGKIIVVTDPPFNVGYHYASYSDRLPESEYYGMLCDILNKFPSVFIHYPEQLHKLSIASNTPPEKVVSWVYNSNTAKQHRDICWYKVKPNMSKVIQPYKNPNDKRIRKRIAEGHIGCKAYDWWNINQVKNISSEKTEHPCQMPLAVMKNIIATLPEDAVIFDPFTGSGTTALACKELGYDFVGCEIDKGYYNIARKRVKI